MPHSVGVVFELWVASTRPGEALQVLGARAEFGEWRPLSEDGEEEAWSLRTCPATYPRWISRVPVWFELDSEQGDELILEYKFVKDTPCLDEVRVGIKWETGAGNRRVSLPVEDGSMWLVSDARWNGLKEPAEVTRIVDDLSAQPRSPSVMDLDFSSVQPEAVLSPLSKPLMAREELPLQPKGEEHFALTPPGGSPRVVGGFSPWAIEAEFSASFTVPSPDTSPAEDAQPPPDARIVELWLENGRLRAALAEAHERIRPLMQENLALRARLGEAKNADARTPVKVELQEPQEEPQATGYLL